MKILTEGDVLESVAQVLAQGYNRRNWENTKKQVTDWDRDMARSVIAKVRAHDTAVSLLSQCDEHDSGGARCQLVLGHEHGHWISFDHQKHPEAFAVVRRGPVQEIA